MSNLPSMPVTRGAAAQNIKKPTSEENGSGGGKLVAQRSHRNTKGTTVMTNFPKLAAKHTSRTSRKASRAKGKRNPVSDAQSQPFTPVKLPIAPSAHSGNDGDDDDDGGESTRNISPRAKSPTLVSGLFSTIFYRSYYSYLMPF